MTKEEIMRTAREVDSKDMCLDEIVEELKKYTRAKENVYMTFNDHKLYSLIDNRNSCYVKCTGKTYRAIHRENNREDPDRKPLPRRQLANWIKRGEAILYPQVKDDWKKYVEKHANEGIYKGKEIEASLQVMESLAKDGDVDKALDVFENVRRELGNGAFCLAVPWLVANYADNGTEFCRRACVEMQILITEDARQHFKCLDRKFEKYREELGIDENEN